MKKPSKMTNEELARQLEAIPPFLMKEARHLTDAEDCLEEAAERLRKSALVETALNINVGMNNAAAKITADLRRRLRVAEETLEKISKDDLCGHREQAARALSDIRAEGGK